MSSSLINATPLADGPSANTRSAGKNPAQRVFYFGMAKAERRNSRKRVNRLKRRLRKGNCSNRPLRHVTNITLKAAGEAIGAATGEATGKATGKATRDADAASVGNPDPPINDQGTISPTRCEVLRVLTDLFFAAANEVALASETTNDDQPAPAASSAIESTQPDAASGGQVE
ncbi:MAG: hypothetical protein Q9183_005746 [Haloplaca sp. 2 TL-2023]